MLRFGQHNIRREGYGHAFSTRMAGDDGALLYGHAYVVGPSATCQKQFLRFVGFDAQQGGRGIGEVEALRDASLAGMSRHIQLAGIIAGGVGHKESLRLFGEANGYGRLCHPLTSKHVQTERAAEAVYPLLLFGQGEAHPRAGIGEPAVATMQGVGGIGYVEYVVEGVPSLLCALNVGGAGGKSCRKQEKAKEECKFVSHIFKGVNGFITICVYFFFCVKEKESTSFIPPL